MKTLLEIDKERGSGSDKERWHRYWSFYDRLLPAVFPKEESIRSLLEIGVWQGESLRTWKAFLPWAKIYGVDIDPNTKFEEERISVSIQDSRSVSVRGQLDPFDILIDDGDHSLLGQTLTFQNCWKDVAPKGLYCIEDIESYDNLSALMKNARSYTDVDRLFVGDFSMTANPDSIVLCVLKKP